MGEECLDILSNSTVHVDVYSIIEYYSIENDYSIYSCSYTKEICIRMCHAKNRARY